MKTTLYGNGQATNEFGHPKVAKDTNFVHPTYFSKYPISLSSLRDLVREFFEVHGAYPESLHVAAPSNGTRYWGFNAVSPSQGPALIISIFYDAAETHVE